MKSQLSTKKGFSILEVMIGIFVFALGLTSIYMMLSGSIKMSDQSRNIIIASYLANEQLELFKNIRDSNFKTGKYWSQLNPNDVYDDDALFQEERYYILENDYSPVADYPIVVREIPGLLEGIENLENMGNYRLYTDSLGRYTYIKNGNTPTNFYRYLYLEEVAFKDNNGADNVLGAYVGEAKLQAFKLTAKVIWTHKNYHSTQVSTVITDWKRY